MKWGRGTAEGGGGGGNMLSQPFQEQHPNGLYVLDFCGPEARLAVEVDGFVHDLPEQAARDARRDKWLVEQGIQVNDRVLEGVRARIEAVGRGEA